MTPTGHPAPARRSRGGMILLIIGAVILALSVAIGVVMAVIGFGGVASGASSQVVMAEGSGSVEAEAGETLALYRDTDVGNRPACRITGPDGEDVTIGSASQGSSYGDNEYSWSAYGEFTASSAGTYEVSCDEGPVMVAPHVSIGGIFGGVGGVLLAVFGGGLGLLLAIVGLVIHLVTRSRTA